MAPPSAEVPRFMPAPGRSPGRPKTKTLPAIMDDAGEVARVAADGDQAAAHVRADFVAGLAFDQDNAAAHADRLPR